MATEYKCTNCGLSTTDPEAHRKTCCPATGQLKQRWRRTLGQGRGNLGRRVGGDIELAYWRGKAAGYDQGHKAGVRAEKRRAKKKQQAAEAAKAKGA